MARLTASVVVVIACWLASPCLARPQAQLSIHLPDRSTMMDEPVRIRVSGLTPGSPVVLRASMVLAGFEWRSEATFRANARGVVEPGRQPSLGGSYRGVQPMGLFWSMQPGAAPVQPDGASNAELSLAPVVTRLTVEAGGRPAASAGLVRRWVSPDVRVVPVREGELVGSLFEPRRDGRRPGVLVLSGSEGGIKTWDAALLASHGYTVLALAYFGEEGRPERLVNIPLEYLKGGIDWLRARPGARGSGVAVLGSSRGGELALLLGATYPEVSAVVAYASGMLVGPGIGADVSVSAPSWSLNGVPLPHARCRATPAFLADLRKRAPFRLRLMNEPCLHDADAVRGALIPVERITGDVLLVSGGDDQTGPASEAAELMMKRLGTSRDDRLRRRLNYPAAGHAIYSAYIPTTRSTSAGRLALGGTPEANAAAQADSWPKVLDFLRDSFREGPAAGRDSAQR